ncbi:hypothetical protein Pyrfu_0336 [Pyrolobus fumarii 1A]|uniref:Uncharacterized protein n=1 Tax=Pyrolobus fumarii (strain DSM 11204 / 1A) TaxID=694429 RepID=G0EFN7_PYRF1|nr:hypothetical protein [Pyrolobus fumarii]AEM38208.1 hypothetical protein Pyrfu_0336 [Pyrolobus fumarii 1A]
MREAPALLLLAILGSIAAATLLALRPPSLPSPGAMAPVAAVSTGQGEATVVAANPYGQNLTINLFLGNTSLGATLGAETGLAAWIPVESVYSYTGCILPGDTIDLTSGRRLVSLMVYAGGEQLRRELAECGARLLSLADLARLLNESASGAVVRVYNSTTLLLDGFGRGSWRVDIDADYAVFRVEGLGGQVAQSLWCCIGIYCGVERRPGVAYQACNICWHPRVCSVPVINGWYVATRPFYIGVYSRYQYAVVGTSTTIAFVEKMLYKNYYTGTSRVRYTVYAWASLARSEAKSATIVWLNATGVTSVNISGVVYKLYVPGWAEKSAVIRDEVKGITLHVIVRGERMTVHPLTRYPADYVAVLPPWVYRYYWWYPNITGYVNSIVDPYWLTYGWTYPWVPAAEAVLVTFRYVAFNSGPVTITAPPASVVCWWIDYDRDGVRDAGEVACTWTRDGRITLNLPSIDAYNASIWVASTASGAQSLAVLPGGGLEATGVDVEGLVLNATLPGGSLEVQPGTVVYAEAACTTSLTLVDSAGHRVVAEPEGNAVRVTAGSRSETLPCSGGYRIYWLAGLVTIETGEATASIPYTAPVGTVRLEAGGDAWMGLLPQG